MIAPIIGKKCGAVARRDRSRALMVHELERPNLPLSHAVGWIAYREAKKAQMVEKISTAPECVQRAWEYLRASLVEGRIRATGLRGEAGCTSIMPRGDSVAADAKRFPVTRREIADVEWVDLHPGPALFERPFRIPTKILFPESSNMVASNRASDSYDDVRLLTARLLELWPLKKTRLSEAEAHQIICEKITSSGGYIPQRTGAEIVRTIDPAFPKERAMAITKSLTGNAKPGPKGPRKSLFG